VAREITMDDLLKRQRQMAEKAQALSSERDVERIQQITAELEQDGKDLERLAKDFEKQELAKAGPPPKGKLEVMLTPGQRERVKKITGVDLASVVVADEMGVLSKAMPSTDPRDIEILAINEARKLAALKDADVKMQQALAQAIADIENSGFGEVVQKLEELKRDPNWMGGLLNKKK
jgi:hypothetical protein